MKTRFDSNRALATADLLQAAGVNPRVSERTLTQMAQSHVDAKRDIDAASSGLQDLADAISGKPAQRTAHERQAREAVGAVSPNVAFLRLQVAMQRSNEVLSCLSGVMHAFDDMDRALRGAAGLPRGAYRQAEFPPELVAAVYSGVTAALAEVDRALADAQQNAMLPIRHIRT